MDLILALQKELGSVRGLPADMQYVKNAMAILSEARKQQAAQQSVQADVCHKCGAKWMPSMSSCSVCGTRR